MLELRIIGTEEEIEKGLKHLETFSIIVNRSRLYPASGVKYCCYVTVLLDKSGK